MISYSRKLFALCTMILFWDRIRVWTTYSCIANDVDAVSIDDDQIINFIIYTYLKINKLTLTPHIPTLSTLPRRLKSNMVNATTPAPLSLSAAVPPTYPVVYSPVPTMSTLAFAATLGRFASGSDDMVAPLRLLYYESQSLMSPHIIC